MRVNFRTSDFKRQVADANALTLKNRYFEENPFLTEDGAALISRPGLQKLTVVGNGPIRGMKSEPGSFDGDMFIASGENLYRLKNDLTQELLFSGLSNPERGVVKMAITGNIGETPAYLFITDGVNLLLYMDNGYARNTLSGTVNNNDVVRIGDLYYRYTNGSLAGNPVGTSADPYLVSVGISNSEALRNLFLALNNKGEPGVDYSVSVESNPLAQGFSYTASTLTVSARIAGIAGNSVVTTETGTSINWTSGGTMIDGGDSTVSQVFMPDDVGAIDVAVIKSYVIVIPRQEDGFQGRFYWIDPGEIVIDPLNFATAERSPDGVFGVEVFGDQFWLPGQSTTEVWYPTGDPNFPMRRLEGVVFDRGSWENTAQAIHETLVVTDADGGVFLIKGGAPQRVSTPDIEETIRKAIAAQSSYLY